MTGDDDDDEFFPGPLLSVWVFSLSLELWRWLNKSVYYYYYS